MKGGQEIKAKDVRNEVMYMNCFTGLRYIIMLHHIMQVKGMTDSTHLN